MVTWGTLKLSFLILGFLAWMIALILLLNAFVGFALGRIILNRFSLFDDLIILLACPGISLMTGMLAHENSGFTRLNIH